MLRNSWTVLAAYLVLAVVATHPLLWQAGDHIYGAATPPLNVWAMGFVEHQLPRAPLALFDGNVFYPYPRTLALSEHLLVPALLGWPVTLLTGNLVATHNLVALLTLALAGLGMYRLAFHLTGDAAGAFIAGSFYAFHTWNINELIRIQILSNQWFPFLLLALLLYFEAPSPRRAAAAGGFALLQALSCMYWTLYLPLLVAPTLAYLLWRLRPRWRSLLPLGAGLGMAALVVGLFLIPYLQNARELGQSRDAPDPVPVDRYLEVRPANLLYTGVLPTATRGNENAAHFLGFAALGLALAGSLARRPAGDRLRRVRPLLLGFALAGFLLSLGVVIRIGDWDLGPGPYALLRRLAPGFGNVRYPERFSIFVVLALGPLIAAGTQWLRPRAGRAVVAGLGVLVFAEHLSIPLPLLPLAGGARLPEVYHALARDPTVAVVAEVPASRYHLERDDAWPMYASTAHWKRTLQGFTGYFPPAYNFMRWRLFHFPEPESVAFLQKLGVDALVVSPTPGRPSDWAQPDPSWPLTTFADGYRLLRIPGASGVRFAPPEAAPELVEIDRAGFKVRASWPGAERAIDGDNATAWTSGDEIQAEGDFFRVVLPQPLPVARISISVLPPYEFPMRLRVLAGGDDDSVQELAFDEAKAYDGLFRSLLHAPRDPRLDIDLPGRPVRSLRLRVREKDLYWMPWTMAEIRLYRRR